MASFEPRRLKAGEFWRVRVKLRNGVWHWHNSGIPVVRDEEGEISPYSCRKARRAAESLQIAESSGKDPFRLNLGGEQAITVAAAVQQYLQERRPAWSNGTLEMQSHTLGLLCEQFALRSITSLARLDVVGFRDALLKRGARSNSGKRLHELSNVTLNIHIRNLNAFFRWCRAALRHPDWQPPILGQARVTSGEIGGYYRPSELLEIAQVARGVFQNAVSIAPLIAFAVATGMRRGEMLVFARSWINRSGRTIVIPAQVTKTLSAREIPIDGDLQVLLERLEGERPFGMFREDVTKKFGQAVARSGMRKLKLHSLRDSAAVRWLMLGKSLQAVKQLLGHASIETTERHYTGLGLEELRAEQATRQEWTELVPRMTQIAFTS